MTDRDLFPRKFNLFGKDGSHYAVGIIPRWDLKDSEGPDQPQGWAEDPKFTADVTVNEVPVGLSDLKSVIAGSHVIRISPVPSNEAERPQNGKVIDERIAQAVWDHYTEVMNELQEQWELDQDAEAVVDKLLTDEV